jgi:putative endonuclease
MLPEPLNIDWESSHRVFIYQVVLSIHGVSLEKIKKPWQLYIIETEANTLYTGITNDLENRWLAHQQGRGAKYLRSHKPRKIVYIEAQENRSVASQREAEIKNLSREQKLQLIQQQ